MKTFLPMTDSDSLFFKAFGERIALFRKAKGMTQLALSELLEVDQTAIAYYESGRRRIPLSRVHALANALGVTVQDLLERESSPAKRGPSPKLQQQIDQIATLPRAKQKFVSDMLNTVLQTAS